jgi:hypothetical protein
VFRKKIKTNKFKHLTTRCLAKIKGITTSYIEEKSILSQLPIIKEYLSFPPSKTLLKSFNLSCSSFMKLESLLAEVSWVFFDGFSFGVPRFHLKILIR